MKILLIFIIVLFFLSGCENFYSKTYDQSIKSQTIPCVKIHTEDIFLKKIILDAFTKEKIPVNNKCSYTIKVTSKLLSQCNNPLVKSIGADFDGFLRFDLIKNKKLLYRCQIDWKGRLNKERVVNLIKVMEKEITFQKKGETSSPLN